MMTAKEVFFPIKVSSIVCRVRIHVHAANWIFYCSTGTGLTVPYLAGVLKCFLPSGHDGVPLELSLWIAKRGKTLLVPKFIFKLLPQGGGVVHLWPEYHVEHGATNWLNFLLSPWGTKRIIRF